MAHSSHRKNLIFVIVVAAVSMALTAVDSAYAQRSFSAEAPISGDYIERPRAQPTYPQGQQYYPQQQAACRDCGVVESVREVRQEGEGSGLGAVGGAVVGGLIGNQVGGVRGRTVGAVVGAVGGAYGGNEAEKAIRAKKRYDITVRFDDGNTRVFSDSNPPPLQRGDRVRMMNGQLVRM